MCKLWLKFKPTCFASCLLDDNSIYMASNRGSAPFSSSVLRVCRGGNQCMASTTAQNEIFLLPAPCESLSHHQQSGDSTHQPWLWGSEQDRSVHCCLYILQREVWEAQEQGSATQITPCAWGHTVAGLAQDPSSSAVQWSSPGTDAAAHRPSWQCLQCRSWWCTTASTWRQGI